MCTLLGGCNFDADNDPIALSNSQVDSVVCVGMAAGQLQLLAVATLQCSQCICVDAEHHGMSRAVKSDGWSAM